MHPIPFSIDESETISTLQRQIASLQQQLTESQTELAIWQNASLSLNVFEQLRNNFYSDSLPYSTWTNESFTSTYDVSYFLWNSDDEFYEYWRLVLKTRNVPQYCWYISPIIKPAICVTARTNYNTKTTVDTVTVHIEHGAQVADDNSWYLVDGTIYLKTPKDNQSHDFYIDFLSVEGSATLRINPSTPRMQIIVNQ